MERSHDEMLSPLVQVGATFVVMARFSFPSLVGAGSAIAILLAEGACSSDDAAKTAPACMLPAGTQDDFCDALSRYDGRCGHCDDCTGRNREKCVKRGGAISAAYRAAFISCKDSMPCVANAAFVGCVADAMAKATPTAAQAQAKDAYCAACSATHAADCVAFFAAGGRPGYNVLLAGDATVTRAATLCASKCDPFEYGVCIAIAGCADTGGDFCADGGFCAAQ